MKAARLLLCDDQHDLLVDILHRHEDRCKAIANLIHTTDAERRQLIYEMSVCQTTYLQLEGAVLASPPAAPDWDQEEVLPGV